MAQKSNDTDPRLDKRVVDRLVSRGAVTKAELEKHLAGLKDVSDQAENIADIVYGQVDKSNVQ